MSIVLDLNRPVEHADRTLWEALPIDTVMLVSALRNIFRPHHEPIPATEQPPRSSSSAIGDDDEITWEDAEWQ